MKTPVMLTVILLTCTPLYADPQWPATTTNLLLAESNLTMQDDDVAPVPAAPFAQGSWTFQTYGSAVVGDVDKGELYSAHVGVGYFFKDDLSINMEGVGGYADAERDDNGGYGAFDLLFRWHFYKNNDWTIFLTNGAGIQQSENNFPDDNNFNFRLQTGVGATWQMWDNARLMGGVRYIHISNAGISDSNEGLDGALIFAGLMFDF